MAEPMREAMRRALQGEPVKRVARELGLPESTVRWNLKKLRRPAMLEGAQIPKVGTEPGGAKAQQAAQAKTLDPNLWLDGARVIRQWLVQEISLRLQKEPQRLHELLVAFGILSDKIHAAEGLLSSVNSPGAVAAAEARVVIMVQEGGRVVPLEEFVGDPPKALAEPVLPPLGGNTEVETAVGDGNR